MKNRSLLMTFLLVDHLMTTTQFFITNYLPVYKRTPHPTVIDFGAGEGRALAKSEKANKTPNETRTAFMDIVYIARTYLFMHKILMKVMNIDYFQRILKLIFSNLIIQDRLSLSAIWLEK